MSSFASAKSALAKKTEQNASAKNVTACRVIPSSLPTIPVEEHGSAPGVWFTRYPWVRQTQEKIASANVIGVTPLAEPARGAMAFGCPLPDRAPRNSGHWPVGHDVKRLRQVKEKAMLSGVRESPKSSASARTPGQFAPLHGPNRPARDEHSWRSAEETKMEDLVIRFLFAALGIVLMLFGVSLLVIRGVVRAVLSPLRPRVIIVQQSASHEQEPSFMATMKPPCSLSFG
jgi:hypothetical protein